MTALRAALAAAGVEGLEPETLERFARDGGDADTVAALLAALHADPKVKHPERYAASLLAKPDPEAWQSRVRRSGASAMPAHYDGQAPQLLGRYLIAEGERWPSWAAWGEAVVDAWRTGTYSVVDLAWFSRLGEEPAHLARVRRTLEEAGEDPDQPPGSRRAAPSTNGRPPPRSLEPSGGTGDA